MQRDTVAERILLSSILQYGADAFYEASAIVKENDFSLSENKELFSVFADLTNSDVEQFDYTTVCKTFETKFGSEEYRTKKISRYVEALQSDGLISIENISLYAQKIAKQSIIQQLGKQLEIARKNLDGLTGEEKVVDIIAEAEKTLVKFTTNLINTKDYELIGSDIEAYIQYLEDHKGESVGIPTGFPKWDQALGGGLISGGFHLVGARAKVGKSYLGLNVGWNVTGNHNIPVLVLDTELNKKMNQNRLLALASRVDVSKITTGLFADNDYNKGKIKEAASIIKDRKLFYENVSGVPYQHWLSIIRKWIIKDVGFTNGRVNPCVVIIDYIKLTDTKEIKHNLQEHQVLGQLATDLHTLCIQYDIPVLAFVQLNRDGIHQDGQGVIAGSDKLMGLCSSFSILRKKAAEDYAADPINNGNRKLIVVDGRFGPGLKETDYINIKADLSISSMVEGPTRHEIENTQADDDGNKDDSPFE